MVVVSPNFEAAFLLLADVSDDISRGCTEVILVEDLGLWSIHLKGDMGPGLNRVVRAFGFQDRPTTEDEDSAWVFTHWAGYRGRVRITITQVEHKVRRVTGRKSE